MVLLRDGVDHAPGLVDLGLGLGDVEGLASGLCLRGRDADGLRDGVPGEALALVLVQEVSHELVALLGGLLLLGLGGLALGVLLVQLLDEGAAGGVHVIGDVGVKNGLEVFTSSHGNFLSALHALGVGHHPIFVLPLSLGTIIV